MAAAVTRVGVLGGTFDPIHRGHVAMARAARRHKSLDTVLLIPSGTPPHKRDVQTPAAHRLAMVRLAVANEPGLEASEIEVSRSGTSYTVDTLEELAAAWPGARFWFILGADSIRELPGWRRWRRILELVEIISVPRPGSEMRFDARDFPGIAPELLARCEANRLDCEAIDVASSTLRARLAAGDPCTDALPTGVADYIERHGLYRETRGDGANEADGTNGR